MLLLFYNCSNVSLKTSISFSSTFFAKSSKQHTLLKNCHFSFPNCSKRMLRDFAVAPNVSTLGQSGAANEVHNSVS